MSKVPKKISTSELNASPKYAGFTLLVCLATLSMLSLIFLMLSGVFTQSQEINRRIQGRQELEWHVFLVQLENQFALGTFKSVEKSELVYVPKYYPQYTTRKLLTMEFIDGVHPYDVKGL